MSVGRLTDTVQNNVTREGTGDVKVVRAEINPVCNIIVSTVNTIAFRNASNTALEEFVRPLNPNVSARWVVGYFNTMVENIKK